MPGYWFYFGIDIIILTAVVFLVSLAMKGITQKKNSHIK